MNGINQANGFQNRFEFQGREREITFNLNRVNLGARTINPTIGRFDRIDPLADTYAVNTVYGYVSNNPIGLIDPTGMAEEDPFFALHYEGQQAKDEFRKLQEKARKYDDSSPDSPNETDESIDGDDPPKKKDANWQMVKDNVKEAREYWDKNNGDISNYGSVISYTSGATANGIDKILKNRTLRVTPATTIIRFKVGVNMEVSTLGLNKTSKILGKTGNTLGYVGLAITGYQLVSGQITGYEAATDATFGAISFWGPIGAGIGITYFGGKWIYESYTGKTLFEKPKQESAKK